MSQATDNTKLVTAVQGWLINLGYDLGKGNADGWAGGKTRIAWYSETDQPLDPPPSVHVLPGFRGDLGWIHRWEGHRGSPYWPRGSSGVTLDPGVDLGHADPGLVAEAYVPLLTTVQFAAVDQALGLRGSAAEEWLANDPTLQSIRITEAEAAEIFPLVAKPYWVAIMHRFPGLTLQKTPSEVHTAMLSIAYNRGARNARLEVLKEPIVAEDWRKLGELIAGMQQDHELEGVQRRRRAEGALILGGGGGAS